MTVRLVRPLIARLITPIIFKQNSVGKAVVL